jgi:hypothetical protein
LGSFFITVVAQNIGLLFHGRSYALNVTKSGRLFHKVLWSPCLQLNGLFVPNVGTIFLRRFVTDLNKQCPEGFAPFSAGKKMNALYLTQKERMSSTGICTVPLKVCK